MDALEEQLEKNKEEEHNEKIEVLKHQKRLFTARMFLAQYGNIIERRACKFQLEKMMK